MSHLEVPKTNLGDVLLYPVHNNLTLEVPDNNDKLRLALDNSDRSGRTHSVEYKQLIHAGELLKEYKTVAVKGYESITQTFFYSSK